MAILLRWTVPDSTEIDFTHAYIYRASSEAGAYSELANQLISDNTYFDEEGETSSWYKVRFFNSSTSNWSAYSNAMQGGTFKGYCSLNYVRDLCNITTSDLTDTELYALIEKATTILNSDVNVKVVREDVRQIDNTRQNSINGSNTTFYVQNWEGKFIADRNNDASVDTSDIVVYQVASDGTETELTVSSITPDEGKFVLSSAPSSGVRLYVSYDWAYYSEYTPDEQIKLACAFLSIALGYEKINRGMSPEQVYGNVKFKRDMQAGNEFYKKYEAQVTKINSEMGDYAEADVF